MEDIAKIADRVLVMNKGKIEYFDSVSGVFSHAQQLKKMGLNVPEITDVFLKLKEMGINCKTDIFTLEQAQDEYKRLLAVKGDAYA